MPQRTGESARFGVHKLYLCQLLLPACGRTVEANAPPLLAIFSEVTQLVLVWLHNT